MALTVECDPATGCPRTVILEHSGGRMEYYPITDHLGAALGNSVRHYRLGEPLVTPALEPGHDLPEWPMTAADATPFIPKRIAP